MAVVWRLGLILLGFAIATVVAAVSQTTSAHAQETRQSAIATDRDGDPFTAYESQPRQPTRGTADEIDAPDGAADADASGESEPGDQDSDPPTLSDSGGGERSGAAMPADGDLSSAVPTATSADGVEDLGEPVPLEDGDPTADTRPDADLEIFNQPPAGHDPLLFQIEDIDPLRTDRRPARLARFEPYDPVGIRIGSFVFFPEIELAGVATNNVLSSPDAQSDIAAEIASKSRFVSNWSVHALEFRWTTLDTFQDDFPSEDDRAWSVEARGRLDVTRRTNFQARVAHSLTQESRTAVDANQTGERPDVTSDTAELAFNHRFNRLSVQLRGSVSDTTYSETDGQSNRDRDTLETTEAARIAWEFKPTLSIFAEQELNQREKKAVPPDGIPRDSDGTRTRIGLDFGSTGAILRGEVSLGYGRQTPDDPRLSPVDTLLFDANLAWRMTEITSLLLTARTDIYETTTTDSGGVASHTVGLELRHAFQRYLVGTAGLIYTNANYSGVDIEENDLLSYAMAEYYASPDLILFARYEHLDFASNEDNADYDSDTIRAGVRIRR